MNLEQRFGKVSATHILQLRSRLHLEYLQKIKHISDSLMVAGAPISDHDLIVVTLNGLLGECESFIESIMLRISFTTLDELNGFLLNKEILMNRKKKKVGLFRFKTISSLCCSNPGRSTSYTTILYCLAIQFQCSSKVLQQQQKSWQRLISEK